MPTPNKTERCKFCSAFIVWLPSKFGRLLPVYPEERADGGLVKVGGQLVRYDIVYGNSVARFRSHLLDCKPLAQLVYSASHIKLDTPSASTCSFDWCDVRSPHIHCFMCNLVGHVAADCEDEEANSEFKEVV